MPFQWLEEMKKMARDKRTFAIPGAPDAPLSSKFSRNQAPAGQVNLGSVRFTGLGGDGMLQSGNPTGTQKYAEHEGEVVIPSDIVQDIGGPESFNGIIEQLRAKNKQERSGTKGFYYGGNVPGEEKRGKNGLTAQEMTDQGYDMSDIYEQGLEPPDPKTLPKPDTRPLSSIPGTSTYNVADDYYKPKTVDYKPDTSKLSYTPTEDSPAAKVFKEKELAGIGRIDALSQGNSPILKKIADQSRTALAGSQGQERAANRQLIAQTTRGAPSGATTAAMAVQGAQQGDVRGKLESDIARQAFDISTQATKDLVAAAQAGKDFEENKRQYGEDMAFRIDDFNERKRQFGENQALNWANYNSNEEQFAATHNLNLDQFKEDIRRYDFDTAMAIADKDYERKWRTNEVAIDAAVAAGDVKGLAEIYRSMGIAVKDPNNPNSTGIDLSTVASAGNLQKINETMANMLTYAKAKLVKVNKDGNVEVSGAARLNASSLYKAIKGTDPVEGSVEYQNWLNENFKGIVENSDPISAVVDQYRDKIPEMFKTWATFEYGGEKGTELYNTFLATPGAVDKFVSTFSQMIGSGLFDPTTGSPKAGSFEDKGWDNLIEVLYGKEAIDKAKGKTQGQNVVTLPARIKEDDIPEGQLPGTSLEIKGKNFFYGKDGSLTEIKEQYGNTPGTMLGAGDGRIYNGSTWNTPQVGSTFEFTTGIANDQDNADMPKGFYTVENVVKNGVTFKVFRDLSTGLLYLAGQYTTRGQSGRDGLTTGTLFTNLFPNR